MINFSDIGTLESLFEEFIMFEIAICSLDFVLTLYHRYGLESGVWMVVCRMLETNAVF